MTQSNNPLLMRCGIDELRRKLLDTDGPLAPWWQHFLRLARIKGEWFSPYTVLAALVTGEDADLQRAKDAFCRFVELAPQALGSNEAQFHTHVTAAPVGRWAIYYDWLSELGLFNAREDAEIRAALLDHAYVFPLQALQGRIRSFDNQILANAFCATAVGYVCGVKRGDSAMGRRLFGSGLAWLGELMKLLPADGYSGEGSTYQEHVVMPMVTLSALLMQETNGQDVLNNGVAPGLPAMQVLRHSHNLIGPGGMMPAWDDHGYQLASVKGPLVYFARATGDATPLATIRATGMWSRTTLPAWEADDRLWTLVWWPSEIDDGRATRDFGPWMDRHAAGALQNGPNSTRLFQYWDICGGLSQAGRLQTDPNAITLEAYGSPLLVDGYGQLPPELAPLPAAAREYVGERMLETVKEYRGGMSDEAALRLALSGSVAAANALIFDDESWFVPREVCTGTGQELRGIGQLQMVRSDGTAFYAERYGAKSVTRTSILCRGEYVLTCDLARCDEPHALTWQAFLRSEAREQDRRIVIETPEQVRCDIFPLQEGSASLTAVPSYPSATVNGSVLMQYSVAGKSADARLDFAFLPQRLYRQVADVTEGWRSDSGDRDVSLDDFYLHDKGEAGQGRRFRRNVDVPAAENELYISVRQASRNLRLRVNGRDVAPTMTQHKGIWADGATYLPHWFDISSVARAGENEIELSCPEFHGETLVGPVLLLAGSRPMETEAVRTGADTFSVRRGDATDEIVLERQGFAPWLRGATDARYALLCDGQRLSASGVTRLELPGLLLLNCRPACDIEFTPESIALGQLETATELSLEFADGWLRLGYGGALQVTYQCSRQRTLEVPWPHDGPVYVNGKATDARRAAEGLSVVIDLPVTGVAAQGQPADADELYALDERGAATDKIVRALDSADWRLQVAACDLAGRRGLAQAAARILELFLEAETEFPYPTLEHWWRFSKMLQNAKRDGYEPDLPEAAIKRWRVRRAAVTALGLLGYEPALPALEAALASCHDFFPVTSQLAVALGRLGAESSIDVVRRHVDHAEVNTRIHARLALQVLLGEIDRTEFESRAGLA